MSAKLRKDPLNHFYICSASITALVDFTIACFILLLFFFTSFLVRLYYYSFYFAPFAFIKEDELGSKEKPAVSVIIAAKDEANNLKAFLPKILSQDYSSFEVIVVDDHSVDDTWQVLQDFQKNYEKVTSYQLENDVNGKKNALQLGISKAKNSLFLFIDADCYPSTDKWIEGMARKNNNYGIILGYGRYQKRKGFLNMMIRYDTFYTGIRYLSFAKAGKPYMGVGRNLLYTKEVFNASSAFQKHNQIAFGDDDLLVNEMSTHENTSYSVSPYCHTLSLPSENFRDFFFQKMRHLKAGKYYKASDKVRLAMEGISRTIFLVSGVLLLLLSEWVVLPFIIAIVAFQQLVVLKATKKLEDKDLVIRSIVLEPLHLFILSLCAFFSLFYKKTIWK